MGFVKATTATAMALVVGMAGAAEGERATAGRGEQVRTIDELLGAENKAALEKVRPTASTPSAIVRRESRPQDVIEVESISGVGDRKVAMVSINGARKTVRVGDVVFGYEVTRVGGGCASLLKSAPVGGSPRGASKKGHSLVLGAPQEVVKRDVCFRDGGVMAQRAYDPALRQAFSTPGTVSPVLPTVQAGTQNVVLPPSSVQLPR